VGRRHVTTIFRTAKVHNVGWLGSGCLLFAAAKLQAREEGREWIWPEDCLPQGTTTTTRSRFKIAVLGGSTTSLAAVSKVTLPRTVSAFRFLSKTQQGAQGKGRTSTTQVGYRRRGHVGTSVLTNLLGRRRVGDPEDKTLFERLCAQERNRNQPNSTTFKVRLVVTDDKWQLCGLFFPNHTHTHTHTHNRLVSNALKPSKTCQIVLSTSSTQVRPVLPTDLFSPKNTHTTRDCDLTNRFVGSLVVLKRRDGT
jgi:hypothetical protein